MTEERKIEAHEIQRRTSKVERLQKVEVGKTPEEIQDEGVLPGNQLGAGGLDTVFWRYVQNLMTACFLGKFYPKELRYSVTLMDVELVKKLGGRNLRFSTSGLKFEG